MYSVHFRRRAKVLPRQNPDDLEMEKREVDSEYETDTSSEEEEVKDLEDDIHIPDGPAERRYSHHLHIYTIC